MKNNRKLIALTMAGLIALTSSFAGCKQKEDETAASEPQTSVVETSDTPDTADIAETKDTPDTFASDSDDEDEEVKTQPLIMAVKSSPSTSSKDTSSKSTSSKNASSAGSAKNTSSKKTNSSAVPTTTASANNGNAGSVNTQNTVTAVPDPEPVQSTPQQTQPVVSYYEPEPTPQLEPEPEPTPQPDPEPEPPAIDSPYARPFDVETIRNDMIVYGQECGLILDESMDIDNSAWTSPENTRWWRDEDCEALHLSCLEEIDSILIRAKYDGVQTSDVRFNIQLIEITEYPGEYRIYLVYG